MNCEGFDPTFLNDSHSQFRFCPLPWIADPLSIMVASSVKRANIVSTLSLLMAEWNTLTICNESAWIGDWPTRTCISGQAMDTNMARPPTANRINATITSFIVGIRRTLWVFILISFQTYRSG